MQLYQTLPNLDILSSTSTLHGKQQNKLVRGWKWSWETELRFQLESAPSLVAEYPVDPNRRPLISQPEQNAQLLGLDVKPKSLISLGEHQPARPAIQDLDICESLGSINKSRYLQMKHKHLGVNKKKQQAYLVMASSMETNTSNESIVCVKLRGKK